MDRSNIYLPHLYPSWLKKCQSSGWSYRHIPIFGGFNHHPLGALGTQDVSKCPSNGGSSPRPKPVPPRTRYPLALPQAPASRGAIGIPGSCAWENKKTSDKTTICLHPVCCRFRLSLLLQYSISVCYSRFSSLLAGLNSAKTLTHI